ncbi:hypothetical protein KSP39_PZI011878 [Platanthera zijinensis]|uniref:Uncharacterized protein n=1 Tax=Platanthera zijinensis TaxID=2320716 RepID=A0AAP0G5B8_9ASPA
MASTSFRSASRRSSMGGGGDPEDAGSSNRLHRSRSLSCYSGGFPPPTPEPPSYGTPRGRFVNKVRGSGFPDISLDDLADEFFRAMEEEECGEDATPSDGRYSQRRIGDRLMAETESSRRRGRSVSRIRGQSSATERKGTSGNSGDSRIRRSVSVSRSRHSELEVDKTNKCKSMSKSRFTSACGSLQKASLHKKNSEGRAFRRSTSQKDFFQSHDCCSSHSSSLTDDEAQDIRSSVGVSEKATSQVYSLQKAGQTDHCAGDEAGLRLFQDKSKEVRNLVEELTKLEKSKKRKQDLLAELAIEEQRGEELFKVVKELLLSPKEVAEPAKPSLPRQGSSDKLRISKCLNEEAERYFEDFLSNVEDTDLSSFDGERSDTGSSTKLRQLMNNDEEELLKVVSLPTESDGVIFPWLQWETSNTSSPSPCKHKRTIKLESETLPQNSSSINRRSSLGSCSAQEEEGICAVSSESSNIKLGVVESRNLSAEDERISSFDMDEYLDLQRSEKLMFEIWEQRHRIASGSLVLCGRNRTLI